MILISELFSSKIFLISYTSSGFLTKDAAIKSKSFFIANKISDLSFSVIEGKFIISFGIFTPLLLLIIPLFFTKHFISLSVLETTSISTKPSSTKIVPPILTSLGNNLYETEQIS